MEMEEHSMFLLIQWLNINECNKIDTFDVGLGLKSIYAE